MPLQATATVWAEGEFDWQWLSQRLALPAQFPLPLPAGRVLGRVDGQVDSTGSATLEIALQWRLPAPLRFFGGRVEIGRDLTLTLTAQFTSAAAMEAARLAWAEPQPGNRLSGALSCQLAMRLAPLPTVGPIHLHLGDAEGWIVLRLAIAAGDDGARITVEASDLGELALQLPGAPLADAPLRLALTRAGGTLTATGSAWSGQLALAGAFRFAPRIAPGEVALLAMLAPLLHELDLSGTVEGVLDLAEHPRLWLRAQVEGPSAQFDLLDLLRQLGRGLSATRPEAAAPLDVSSRSKLGFRLSGLTALIDAQNPQFGLELEALLAGISLPAHVILSLRELRVGVGGSGIARPGDTEPAPPAVELPLRVPHVTAADLGYGGGVHDSRRAGAPHPPDQAIWARLPTDAGRERYDAAVQALVDGIEQITGVASGATGVAVARRTGAGWDVVLRDPEAAPAADAPLHLGLGAVAEQDCGGAWQPSGELALVARIDGAWSVLVAQPRLGLRGLSATVDLRNPRNLRVGGSVAFIFLDGTGQRREIVVQAELSVDAIYFSVQQLEPAPLRLGGIELHIARLLFGFGYTKRSLAFALAGELVLPEALVDALDTSDTLGAGIRVPQRTKLDLKFEIVPLVLGQVVVPVPFFQFDWDGRKKSSPGVQDTRLCEPFWDGAQLIVPGVLRVSLKHLSLSPLLVAYACMNSEFAGDLALGDADTGLTVVVDDAFWAYGQDSWVANLLTLTVISQMPFCDNYCIGLRAAGFRLNFNLQRPVPALSPMAVFELIALACDPVGYHVVPRGPLADSVRISITDTTLVLPARVRRLFPGTDGPLSTPFEHTIDLADYIALLQAAMRHARELVRTAVRARDELQQLAQRLRVQAAALQGGGIAGVLNEVLARLPAPVRRTRLDASFGGFDGSAVLVLADRARAAVELADRTAPGSVFADAEFAAFGVDDLAALPWPQASGVLAPGEIDPAFALALREPRDTAGRALRDALPDPLRRELRDWDGGALAPELRQGLAEAVNQALAGGGRGALLLSRSRARKLDLPSASLALARRTDREPLSEAERVQLNRAIVEATVAPATSSTPVVVLAARLQLAGLGKVDMLGSLAGDGRFTFISALQLPPLSLRVAGLAMPLPLSAGGRLGLQGQVGPSGVTAMVSAEVYADWEPLPGLARLTLGTVAKPVTLNLWGDGRFQLAGAGSLTVMGGLLAIDGQADVSAAHVQFAGRLRQHFGTAFELNLDLAGTIGPSAALALAGSGSAAFLGMPLGEIEARLDAQQLAFNARLLLEAWQPPGRLPTPLALDLRLAGRMGLSGQRDALHLEGRGRVSLFDAEIAEGRAGIELRPRRNGPAKLLKFDPQLWVEGALSWHGQDWLSARIELTRNTCTLRGQTTLDFDLVPPGLPAGLVLNLAVDASVTLHLPGGGLKALSLRGRWFLGARRDADHVLPIAMGELPPIGASDLPRLLLTLPGFLLPRWDADLTFPVPRLKPSNSVNIDIPTSVQLPSLPRRPTPGDIFGKLSDAVVNLGGYATEPLTVHTGFTVDWPDGDSLPLPFERVAGFTVALDWDEAAQRLVLTSHPRAHGLTMVVDYNPAGIDLDAESLTLINSTTVPLNLADWSVHDAADRERRFVFPDVTLAPGASLRVWSGSGADDADNLYWRRAQAVWTNLGDTAVLRDAQGVEVARHTFKPVPKPPR